MRTKKNPGIRREAFIAAACSLFAERGFESVSVQDILNAVNDKSSSPSVFYYYFKSKEEIYRCAVESIAQDYVRSFDDAFAESDAPLQERVSLLFESTAQGLMHTGNLIAQTSTTPNRLFMLDMREHVTQALAQKLEALLVRLGLAATDDDARAAALYITGGIGQLLFSRSEVGAPSDDEVAATMRHVAALSMATLGINPDAAELGTCGANPQDE